MKGWLLGPVAVVLMLFASEAQAADLSLYTGYLNPGSLSLNNVVSGLQLRSSAVYGGRFEVDFHRVLGLEENVAITPNLIRSDIFAVNTDVRGFFYHSNFVLNVPMGHMVPYATAGIGLIKPFGPGLQPFGTRFAFNYGGGVKFLRLAGILGLRFDVRGYAIPDVSSRTANMLEASGGLVFSFGRE